MFHGGTVRGLVSQALIDLPTHGSPPRATRRHAGLRALVLLAVAAAFVFGAAGVAQAATVVPDPNLANAINSQLGHTWGSEITTEDMAALNSVYTWFSPISSLEGMQYATNIRSVALYGTSVSDLSQLASCTAMTQLTLGYDSNITDVSVLAGLPNLTELGLECDRVSDITPLSGLSNLQYLSLYNNPITDIAPLGGLTNLANLDLGYDYGLTGMTPVANLTKLTTLYIEGNQIEDITPVSGLAELTNLDIDSNRITDIAPVSGLTKLTYLSFAGNQVTTITPVAGLTDLTNLSCGGNQISDITPVAGLTNMQSLSVGQNQITDLAPVAGMTDLTSLYVNNNQVVSITPVAGLTKLTFLEADSNQIESLTPLAGLTGLTELRLDGNRISDVAPLAGLSKLSILDLGYNVGITDISPLSGLSSMTNLYLEGNAISSISPLAGLTNLTDLELAGNNVADISPLSGMTNMTNLGLGENHISDITALGGMTDLQNLTVDNNGPIRDITPLSGLTRLNSLNAYSDGITDIAPLAGLTNLTNLDLGGNRIADVAPLSGLTNLNYLYLQYNRITSATPLAGLSRLYYVYLWGNDLDVSEGAPALATFATLREVNNTNVYYDPQNPRFQVNYAASDGGTIEGDADQLVYLGSDGTTVTAVPAADHFFVMWSDGETAAARSETNLTNDFGARAIFAPYNGTITYSAGEGGSIEGSSTQVLAYDSTGDTVTAVPDTGHHFTGWSDDGDSAERSDVMSGDATYTASFDLDMYRIAFDGNGGTPETDSAKGVYGRSIGEGMPDQPTREGYTFAGWNTKADGSGDMFSGDTIVDGPITLYAQWTALTGTLTYSADKGGSIEGSATQVLAYGATGDAVTAVPDTGHHFVGWSDDGESATRSDLMSGDAEYTASFDIDIYRIDFDGNGGSPESVGRKAEYGLSFGEEMPEQPTREDYTFAGWNTKADGSGEVFTASTPVDGPITLYAQWTADTAVLRYTAGAGGSIEGSCTQVVALGSRGDTVTAVPDAGYRFVGWNDENASANRSDVVSDDATYAATFALDAPSAPSNVTFGIVSTKATRVNWIGPKGATGFKVYVAGVLVGTAGPGATSFTIPSMLGPGASVTVEAEGAGATHSDRAAATYLAITSVKVATVRFAGGSSALSSTAKRILNTLAQQVKAQGFKALTINGYVRKALSLSASKKLSLARALSVKSYLVARFKALHISVTVQTSAKGYANPVGGNPFLQANHRAEAILR